MLPECEHMTPGEVLLLAALSWWIDAWSMWTGRL